ncbi:MAG: 3-dehydroquinate synthase, partial [Acidobacteria bacterium]|nr:3-dehydroquinate synthase [Acidobacteriota bacterium]
NLVSSLKKYYPKERTAAVISEKIARLYPSLMKDFSNFAYFVIPFKDGEGVKNFSQLKKIVETLIKAGADKETLIIATGGGTLLDLCGFASSILFRGLRWIAVPTTILSMADASIGGKTAINSIYGKNLIGSFHFPERILIDLNFLKTLPKIHFKSGLVECAKCGLLKDKKLFEECVSVNQSDFSALKEIIQKAQNIKISIVEKDPFEEKGERCLLNLGHTVGHSLERIFNYKVSHGRCVAEGIIIESAISLIQGFLKEENFYKIKHSMNSVIAPVKNIPEAEEIWEKMKFDKKSKEKRVYYVPLKEIGMPALKSPYLAEIDFASFKKAFFLIK